jgi:hypothetical protein
MYYRVRQMKSSRMYFSELPPDTPEFLEAQSRLKAKRREYWDKMLSPLPVIAQRPGKGKAVPGNLAENK